MRVGYIQFKPILKDKKRNLERAEYFLNKFDGELAVLPELFGTGYLLNRDDLERLSEDTDGDTIRMLKSISRNRRIIIVAGFAEYSKGNIYNSSVMLTPEGEVYIYRKIHLFFKEKDLFTPGDIKPGVYRVHGVNIGMIVCFDYFFPELIRTLALMGVDIVCHPSNLVLPYAPVVMPVRSIENRIFTITANRVGMEKDKDVEYRFIGMSQITSPKGDVLKRASQDEEEIGVVDIDVEEARNKMLNEKNHIFNDRREDMYNLWRGK